MARPREQEDRTLEKPVMVRLDRATYERLERLARADDRRVGAMARRLIEYALAHFEKELLSVRPPTP